MFDKIKKQTKGKSFPIAGINEQGEPTIIYHGVSEIGEFYRVDTAQANGWIRTNIYYSDGSGEELYDK